MRNGRGMSGRTARSRMTATTWPMNWTRIRVVSSASITIPREKVLHRIAITPMTTSETCGKCFSGCTLPNTRKNVPSSAAA